MNVSPKGMNTLRVLSKNRIRWLNLSGSGNETAAHLRLSNRMTLMFCAFNGRAQILRVYGHATIIHPRDPEWDLRIAEFSDFAGTRQIFDLDIDLVQTSCGSGIPVMQFERDRGMEELVPFYDEMGPDGVTRYWRKKNMRSIDGFSTGIFDDED